MRVFVAGATGAIGRQLVPLLISAGHEVTGMTRSAERARVLETSGATAAQCDALDADAVREAVTRARAEAVIHELTDIPRAFNPRRLAAEFEGTNRLRREGTRNLVAAARAAGAERLVAQSVAFMYEQSGDWIKEEDAPLALDPAAPAGEVIGALADLERQVLEADGIVLRYGYLYGPGTSFAPDGAYAAMARKRRLPIVGSGEGRWPFIHVRDAAEATVAALEHGSRGVYNIVDDEPAPAREWIPVFAASVGAPAPRRVPAWLGRLVAGAPAVGSMTMQRGASNAKAKRELGWQPSHPSWRQGFSSD